MSKDIYKMPAHEYSLAGIMKTISGGPTDKDGNYTEGRFKELNAGTVSGIGAGVSLAGNLAGKAISGGMESTAGNILSGLGGVASMIPGPYGAAIGAGLNVLSGITNAAFGSKINQENVNAINNNISAMNSFQSDASDFDSLAENINSQPTAMKFNQKTVGSDGWFSNKAKNMYNDLVAQQEAAQQFVNNSLTNNMNNLVNNQYQNMAATYAAEGGPLETQGSDWTTGLNYIGAGGSHEQNPYDGVQMGIAPDGLPNLVEEGEVIWNGDYVFSKRLKVNKSDKEDLKLGYKDKSLSFADAALKLNKEMEEMPNDPIAKRSRDAMLSRLAEAQEEKRAKIEAKEQRKAAEAQMLANMMGMPTAPIAPEEQPVEEQPMEPQMSPEEVMQQQAAQGMPMTGQFAAKGGPIGHKYPGGGFYTSFLNDPNNQEFLWGLSQAAANNLPLSAYYSGQLGKASVEAKPKFVSTPTSKLTLRENGLGEEYYRWLERLSDEEYQKVLNGIYPNKGNTQENYNKYLNDRVGLFNYANTGEPKGVYNGIKEAGDKVAFENPEAFYGTSSVFDVAKLPGDDYKPNFNDFPVVVGNQTIIPSQNGVEFIPPYNSGGARIEHPHFTTDKNGNIIEVKDQSEYDLYYDPVSRLRYAPAIGSALSVFSDLIGLTNKPDYSAADALNAATKGLRNVSFNPIGDYAKYKPVDTMAMVNQLNANAGATRRNIVNTAGGNRGTAMAGLLAADNSFNNNIGKAYINAEDTNYSRYMNALDHNAKINQFNSQGFLQASMANQRMDEVRARYSALAADARAKALQQASAARSANLTNLFDNLGNLGIDAANRMDARWLAKEWPGATAPSSHGRGKVIGHVTGINGEQIPLYSYKKNGGKIRKRRII